MESVETLNPALQRLVRELAARFGPDVFRVRLAPRATDHTLIENTEDPRVSFTVVTTAQAEARYSVIVYVPWPAGEIGIGPCDHALDRSNVSLDEMLEIFAKYRKYEEPTHGRR